MHAASASRSTSGCWARPAKYCTTGLVGSPSPSIALQDEVAALGAEQVGAHAGEHEAAEALGVVARQRDQHAGAEAEADAVDRLVGQLVEHELLHRRVGRRVVGLVGGAVAEQVDGERRAPDVAEQVEPAVVAPGAGARGGEAVEEDDRGGHDRGTLPARSGACSRRLRGDGEHEVVHVGRGGRRVDQRRWWP